MSRAWCTMVMLGLVLCCAAAQPALAEAEYSPRSAQPQAQDPASAASSSITSSSSTSPGPSGDTTGDADAAEAADDAEAGTRRDADAAADVKQQKPAQPRVISDEALAQLNDEQFRVREALTVALMQDETVTPQALLDAYRRSTTLEQRVRLKLVAEHHVLRLLREQTFEAGLRGSIGMAHAGTVVVTPEQDRVPAVQVDQTFPGFPARAYLEVGDSILAFNGQRFGVEPDPRDTAQQLGQAIQALPADSEVELKILRHGHIETVRFRLAPFEALTEMYSVGEDPLRHPYREAWERFEERLDDEARQADVQRKRQSSRAD